MERNIKILVENTQSIVSITENANGITAKLNDTTIPVSSLSTLGDIKNVVRGFNLTVLDDDIWMEARSQGSYTADNTPLMTNIPFQGSVTNNLIFKVIPSQTKIKSGACRADVVSEMKRMHLEDKVKETFGRNWTQTSTDNIEYVISNHISEHMVDAPESAESDDTIDETPTEYVTLQDFLTIFSKLNDEELMTVYQFAWDLYATNHAEYSEADQRAEDVAEEITETEYEKLSKEFNF